MKRLLLILFAALAASCSPSSTVSTFQLIQGKWVCFGENGVNYPSDSVFAVEFNADRTLSLSRGENDQWGTEEGYTYETDGDVLKVKNTDKSLNITARINYISGATLICTVEEYLRYSAEVKNTSQYTFQYSSNPVLFRILPGLWSSRSVTNTQEEEIWDLNEDLSMDYYIYNTRTETYTESITEGGEYDVMGQYVVLNYPDTYDVWVVRSSQYGQINWFTRTENGSLVYRTLNTISKLP